MNISYVYPYIYRYDYIPVGFRHDISQGRVFRFKEGKIDLDILLDFRKGIQSIVDMYEDNLLVCFIPASDQCSTIKRYCKLCAHLHNGLKGNVEVSLNAIKAEGMHTASHVAGKDDDPTRYFVFDEKQIAGKNIILIDDVITRGLTFNDTADKLMDAGALSVYGVFLAKTYHPQPTEDFSEFGLTIENNGPNSDIPCWKTMDGDIRLVVGKVITNEEHRTAILRSL